MYRSNKVTKMVTKLEKNQTHALSLNIDSKIILKKSRFS